MMSLGLVYFVFLPSIPTTLVAGAVVARFGTRPALFGSLALAVGALPLLLAPRLLLVVIGLGLVAIGTFFAQAVATSFVGRNGRSRRRERSVSRQLLPRRAGRNGGAWADLRQLWLAKLRRGHRSRLDRRVVAGDAAEASGAA
jgi:hypothetical protein